MTNYERDQLVHKIARTCYRSILYAPWFPVKTGRLRDTAVSLRPGPKLINSSSYQIVFDGSIAPYVGFLEEGTGPHDIPRAFGYPLPFGIGGRFGGKFHPGSVKHKGFISNKSVSLCIQTGTTMVQRALQSYLHKRFLRENRGSEGWLY